jgi:hypothetical protein
MVVLVAAESVALVLLTLLVAGLLRSHAEILARLHELGAGPYERDSAGDDRVAPGVTSSDIEAVTPDGDPVVVAVSGRGSDTLLAFLTSGCSTCATFWDAFADLDSLDMPANTRLVVVTKGPEDESESAVAALAPPGVTIAMSSAAWRDYDVPIVPYFVEVDGRSGRQRGAGTGSDWTQVRSLMGQADGDVELALSRVPKARPDAEREERADLDLLGAGLRPGDPSLYPGRTEDG